MRSKRTEKKTWLRSHRDLVPKQIYLAKECSNITAGQIDYCYAKGAYDWCPWVKIGNLYTTVTTGNDVGWRLLIRDHLQTDTGAPRDINVFTGRHGNPEGTLTGDDREIFSDKVPDANHLLQDILQKSVADGAFSAQPYSRRPRIKLWDVGTTDGSTMTKTQYLASECLRNREVVIFAWCWSFLSFFKVTEVEAASFSKWDLHQPYNKPIAEIAEERYGWVTSLAAPPASAKSEWRAKVEHDQKRDVGIAKALFPKPLSLEQVRDTKDSLTKQIKDAQTKIQPTHHH